MKKLSLALALATALASLQIAYGNMAAPSEPDMGAAVTLEENESLAVRSEVLDIVIDGETARITATYQMENTTDEPGGYTIDVPVAEHGVCRRTGDGRRAGGSL